jgi:hypothetical protein
MKAYLGALGALAIVAAAAPALADMLFDSGAPIPGSGGPDLAEFFAADHFELAKASTITGGSFDFSNSAGSGQLPSDLTYTIYANTQPGSPNGPPGAVLATGALTIDSTAFVGNPGQTPHFDAFFTLASSFVAEAATQYWFGVNSPSFTDDVFWVESDFHPAVGFDDASKFKSPSDPLNWQRQDQTLAFTLTGAALPEPASWGLLVMGFATLGVTLRRARQRPAAARG